MKLIKSIKIFLILSFALAQHSCHSQGEANLQVPQAIKTGAERTSEYISLLVGKNVALVVNQSSRIGERHLLDSLLSRRIEVGCVLSPEHGFRGEASAGEKVRGEIDLNTGTPIYSLYGDSKKPSPKMLEGIEVVVFDLQDVGARFYTFISTLHYVMEACAENNISLIILDRPNPNGFYVDGPVLNPEYKSFVGMHPVPVVHGMTVGEYGQMINAEGWLTGKSQCTLRVIPCENYTHSRSYALPVPPSPNLPDSSSIYLYPSLCFFEGTIVSVGRGTSAPFQQIGYPDSPLGKHSFIPKANRGAKAPKYEGESCQGENLAKFGNREFFEEQGLYLGWLIEMYEACPKKSEFFNRPDFFDLLAGGNELRQAIISGKDAETIKLNWKDSLDTFKKTRKKYLLYPDFE